MPSTTTHFLWDTPTLRLIVDYRNVRDNDALREKATLIPVVFDIQAPGLCTLVVGLSNDRSLFGRFFAPFGDEYKQKLIVTPSCGIDRVAARPYVPGSDYATRVLDDSPKRLLAEVTADIKVTCGFGQDRSYQYLVDFRKTPQ